MIPSGLLWTANINKKSLPRRDAKNEEGVW